MEVEDVENIVSFVPSIVLLLQNVVLMMKEPKTLLHSHEDNIGSFVVDIHEALLNMDLIITTL